MNKNKILYIGLFLISILFVIYIYVKTNKNTDEPIPTLAPVKFELLKEIPKNGSETPMLKVQSVEFQFSKPINKDSLILTTTPYEPFTIDLIEGDKTLLVRPTPAWKERTNYTIKISVKSKEGEEIPEIVHKFKIVPMTDSDLSE